MSPWDAQLLGIIVVVLLALAWEAGRHYERDLEPPTCSLPGCPEHPMDRDEPIALLPEGYVVTRAHLDDRITHDLPGAMRRKRD